jgi:CHAT domain-containing protein
MVVAVLLVWFCDPRRVAVTRMFRVFRYFSALMKHHLIIACLLSLSIASATFSSQLVAGDAMGQSPQQSEDVRTLAPGAPVEREISGGQSHMWQIFLSSGDYLRLSVDKKRINIKAELFAPGQSRQSGDKPILSTADGNVPTSHQGVSVFSYIAEASGSYDLEIHASTKESAPKRYTVKLEEQRPAAPQDKIRVLAERAEMEGALTRDSLTMEQRRQTIAHYERSLALWRELGDRESELRLLQRLVNQYHVLGELQIAQSYAGKGIEIAQALDDRYQEANLNAMLGNIYLDLGNNQQALDAYSRAREAFASSSSRMGEAVAIENIGITYHLLGDPQRAIGYFHQAASMFSSMRHKSMECKSFNDLGAAYLKLGELEKALEWQNRALALAREIGDVMIEANTLGYSGHVYLAMGDLRKASDCYDAQLKSCQTLGDAICVASTLKALGDVALLSGDADKAMNLLNHALDQSRLKGQRKREADTLYSIARANYSLGNLLEARKQIEQSLDIRESLRASVARQDLRASFFSSAQSGFDLYIDLLMSLSRRRPDGGYDAEALQASERARARNLLEQLAESNADIRQGVEPQLLERERALQQQLNAKAAARIKAFNNKGADATATAFDKEIAELTSRYQEVDAQIRASSPRYAALTRPEPLAVPDIQRLLDENTVLMEFALGEKRSWLWVVTLGAVTSHQLATRSEIEKATRRVYELLTARQSVAGLKEEEQIARIKEADARFQTEAASLSRILFGQIAGSLRQELKGKRLLIVASGALEYLPFAALPIPSNENCYQPLITEHEIVNLPSASVLSVIRRETAGRAAAPKTVAVLADPVFEGNDPRLLMAAKRRAGSQESAFNTRSAAEASSSVSGGLDCSPLQRAVRSLGRGGLSRLLFSREEADAIADLVPARSLLKATGFQASRPKALSGELSNYRIVHFATHGLLNSEYPELSGLALSLVDENGKAQDGFLRMHEIYNLRLPADLVVLSACQTALGKEIKGEGLVGLTRGFMYAGAERVVASLWQVDDLATAGLMKRFYQGMLKDGLRPAEALRAAQIEMSKQKRWSAPYYWAGFVIQGEWR